MIEQWIETLSDESIDLSAAEIADACFLAIVQHRFGVEQAEEEGGPSAIESASANVSALPSSAELDLPEAPERTPEEPPPEPSASVFTEPSTHEPLASKPIKVPTAPALRDLLPLAKALRPLMQQRPISLESQQLDEEATVQKIAEERVLSPVTEPLTEPWLDLAIVVDESDSMLLWRQTVQELTRFFKHYGVFRDVRLWGVLAGEKRSANRNAAIGHEDADTQREIYIRAAPFTQSHSQDLRHPKSLLDPSRRRLILLVSDCVDDIWKTPQMLSTLALWHHHSPMAMVQMMPEWLWPRTQLRQAQRVWFQSKKEGSVNRELAVMRSIVEQRVLTRQQRHDVKMPILTIESARWQTWALMLADQGSHSAPGFLFSPQAQAATVAVQQRRQQQARADTAKTKAQTFRGSASPIARRLASLLAASPTITLPVVRMVQDSLLPRSEQVHVAEVLLGDILKPKEAPALGSDPDRVTYEFVDSGIRSLLLAEAPVTDTTQVLSAYIRENLDKSLDEFVAWWREGGSGELSQEQLRPIATVAADVLQYRGFKYADFVEAVHERYASSDDDPPKEEVVVGSFPPLVDFNFERAVFTERAVFPPPLDTEKFSVFTLERRKPDSSRSAQSLDAFEISVATLTQVDERWQVSRATAQAHRFMEPLPKAIALEMVAIPGGRFLMGSPDDEFGRYGDESPQHEVAVSPFFMGRYPITQAQWKVVAAMPEVERPLELDPAHFKGATLPVEKVSWLDAVEFCDRLSAHTGREYRLPTEAEWEYACRAGTETAFHFGDMITTEVANYDGSAYANGPSGENREQTTPVDHFESANAWGLSDMHGNVYEWCKDHWHDSYEGAPADGSAWLIDNSDAGRVIRGGSWYINPRHCRSAYRYSDPDVRRYFIGFRVSCAAPRTLA